MKTGFYCKLAAVNLRKNHRLYIPQILAGAGLTAMFYIMLTLSMDDRLSEVRGGSYLPTIMPLGTVVIGLLSVILMFYTNSFLMKQRKREFGLYNILGMEKRHVGRILFWETLLSAICAILGGLLLGVVLYKLCALMICRLLAVESVLGFYHVSLRTLVPSALLFLGLYLLIHLFNRVQIVCMKPVELLQSNHTGEKEPKVKWLLLVVGLGALGAGYGIALTTENPLKALELFFVAVLLVMIGTYFLFVTGSIALLRLLKGNKRFYYHPRHMISVSGLLYRMKQNAVGLASIAILATAVLVMLSTTISIYAGIQDTLVKHYPHQFYIGGTYATNITENKQIPLDDLYTIVETAAKKNGLEFAYTSQQRYFNCAFHSGNGFLADRESTNLNDVIECWFITAEEYEELTGDALELKENEIAVYSAPYNSGSMTEAITVGSNTYDCTRTLRDFPISVEGYSMVDCYGLVVSDERVFQYIFEMQKKAYGEIASEIQNQLVLDFTEEDAVSQVYKSFYAALTDEMNRYVNAQPNATGGWGMNADNKWETQEYLYGMCGTLLFLGLTLAFVFLFATALIIYYKQISEGYEDRERFQIMQKVGMSSAEVKGTIHSQILLVFFLPLLVAAVHIAVAFPILTKLLRLWFQSNQTLFLWCTLGVFGVFAVIYVVIYSLTAKVYYRIVK